MFKAGRGWDARRLALGLAMAVVGASLGLASACGSESPKRSDRDAGGEAGVGGVPAAEGGKGGLPSVLPQGGVPQGGEPQGGEPSVLPQGGVPSGGGSGSGGQLSPSGGGPPTPGPMVTPTAGCGKAPPPTLQPGTFVARNVDTMGTKAADATGVPGPWALTREYFVWLPPNYDANAPYPLAFQAPGCGANGQAVYSLSPNAMPAEVGMIRIGLTPPPNSIDHATNPNQGCFDDVEGDDSVEFAFFSTVLAQVSDELCVDASRVFVSGNATGANLANQLACKFGGVVRGVAANTGGLSMNPAHLPTCNDQPVAGIWIHEEGDPIMPFADNERAIARAMQVNGCTSGTSFDDATFEDYPVGGGQPDGTCQKILGCPASWPLVVCLLPGTGHASHDALANAAFSTFIKGL